MRARARRRTGLPSSGPRPCPRLNRATCLRLTFRSAAFYSLFSEDPFFTRGRGVARSAAAAAGGLRRTSGRNRTQVDAALRDRCFGVSSSGVGLLSVIPCNAGNSRGRTRRDPVGFEECRPCPVGKCWICGQVASVVTGKLVNRGNRFVSVLRTSMRSLIEDIGVASLENEGLVLSCGGLLGRLRLDNEVVSYFQFRGSKRILKYIEFLNLSLNSMSLIS